MALSVFALARPLVAADETAEMPDVVGATVNDATIALRRVGLSAAVVVVSGSPEGTVGGQQPPKGASLATWMPAVLEVRRKTDEGALAPKAVGRPLAQAVTAFARAFDLRLVPAAGPVEAQGTVVAQSPEPGSPLPARGTLTLSFVPDRQLPTLATVPEVRGLAPAEALEALSKAGFEGRVATMVAPGAAQGVVLHQFPLGGTTARRYGRVELVVPNDGPQPPPPPLGTTVPDCVSAGETEAIERLNEQGLVPRLESVEGDEAHGALVASQEPSGGTPAGIGSFVTLRIARPTPTAPPPADPGERTTQVPVPALLGMTLAQATDVTAALGLVLDPVPEVNPAVKEYRVFGQRIAAGTAVAIGTVVRCRISAPLLPAPATPAPALLGLAKGDALARAAQAGYAVIFTDVATAAQPPHRVFAQTEAAGSTPRPGAPLHLSIARPQGTCTWARVPDLSRLRSEEAATALGDAGFGTARLVLVPRPQGDWRVFSQVPAPGTIAVTCQPVTTWVARPQIEGVSVPNLIGQFEARARVLLERGNGLRPVVEARADPSGATAPDVVWSQSPAAGWLVAAGSRVVLAVQPRPSETPPSAPASPDAPPSPPTPPTSLPIAPTSPASPASPTSPSAAAPGTPPPVSPGTPAGTCAVRAGIVPDVLGLEREAALALLRGTSGDLFRNVAIREEVDPSKPRGTVLRQEPAFTGILIPFTTPVTLTVAVPPGAVVPVRRPTTR